MEKPLTKKQQEAVESNYPTTMVIAGPGTGKTHILASRVEYLVKHANIPPQNILALTFSKSGASSMKERIINFLGEDGYKVTVNTFHSFASSLFEQDPEAFEFGGNLKEATDIDRGKIIETIIDELTESNQLKALSSSYDRYHYFKDISNALKQIKKEGVSVDEFEGFVDNWEAKLENMSPEEKFSSRGPTKGEIKKEFKDEEKRLAKNKELVLVYRKYQNKLKESNIFDYEDMIIRAINGLRKSEELRHELHQKYKAILVDEYQDTSGGQNKLLFELIPPNPNIFIVGDDDQAIYRFQGATIENFQDFLAKFPDTEIISLEDNFRSPQFLLDAALSLARNNENRLTQELNLVDKQLLAHGRYKGSKDVSINEFATDMEEASFVVEQILKLNKDGTDWHEISVLTRMNKEQERISEILRQHGIPVFLSSDQNALDEPHTASLFALASACINPHDNENLLEFLLHPATPIKREDVWKILGEYKPKNDKSLYSILSKLIEEKFINDKSAIKTFEILNELSASHTTKSGAHWFNEVLNKTGFMTWVLKQKDYPYILANIRALTDETKRIQAGNPSLKIKGVMEHFRSHKRLSIPLKPSLGGSAFKNAVQVMTAHKVKGLEYETIFIMHAIEGNWSKSRGGRSFVLPPEIPAPEQNQEDERRLFYVALTRAKKQVFITYSKVYTRGIDGLSDKPREAHPSLFVKELKNYIPSKVIEKEISVYLQKTLREPKTHTDLEKEIVRNIVSDPNYALNATNFNTFLDCPNKFLYEKIMRIPTIQTSSLVYGNAVHFALQHYFQIPKETRTLKNFIGQVASYIEDNSTLTKIENNQMITRAKDMLPRYFEETLKREKEPLAVEYSFKKGSVVWQGVRIAGNVDKISPISETDVRFIDYKTSKNHKTKNAIMGKTQDKKAPDMFRQLMFYKLLAQSYDQFNYTVREFILDFVEPNVQIELPINEDVYNEFKKTLKEVWKSIQSLDFLKSTSTCGDCKYCKLS